jgi:putative ABC transport system permease protein
MRAMPRRADPGIALEQAWHDLRQAARGLWHARGFSTAAVLTLALGIAGTTVMFTLVQGVLLRPLPVRDQRSLLVAWGEQPAAAVSHWPFDARQLDALGRESRVLERVAGASYYGAGSGVVFENGTASYLSGTSVTGSFFEVLGVGPLLGRSLSPADDRPGAPNVLVITHALWQRRYGGSQDALGRRLQIGDQSFTIVGVMPPDVGYPRGVEAWMTLAAGASMEMNPAFREGLLRDVDLVARLRPGATLEQARSELAGWVTRLEAGASAESLRGMRPVVRSYADAVVGDVRPAMLVLFAAVVLVLLIASANVANLLLLRGETRRLELAMRATLGAGRGRLARQLLAESLLLSLLAGLLAFAASGFLLRGVVALVPGGLPRLESIRADPLVLLFSLGIVLLAAALAGLAPVAFLSRIDLAAQLQGARAVGGTSGARRGRRGLVTAQVALAVTIVAAAGLLARSLVWLQTAEKGLAADRLAFVELAPRPSQTGATTARTSDAFHEEVVARLEATPGIEGATLVHTPPFAGTGGWDAPAFTAEGQSLDSVEKNPALNLEAIHAGYFSTFGVPILRGRTLTRDDRSGAPEVAIVSEDLAVRTWPGQDPIGKRLKFGRPDSKEAWRTVVGVARPTRYRELAEPRPTLYLPASQFIDEARILVLRSALPLSRVAELARAGVRAVEPGLEVTRVTPFAELAAAPLARPRFSAFLIGVFGGSALLLAAIGLYAVMAAHVRQRHAEIGVRMALGATSSDVRRLVLAEGLKLGVTGAVVGLAGAIAAGRGLRGLLFGVQPLDPVALVGAALLLCLVAAVACYLPARRATKLDPLAVLRSL